jgi:transcriptional regulator with XRE-family HTH domain/tetratricopeptide (TPR) repeat protein
LRWDNAVRGGAGGDLSSAELASLVRDRRQAAGLTQPQLAAAAGVSVGLVRDLEQGRTRRPRRQSVQRIAAVLGAEPGAGDGRAANVRPTGQAGHLASREPGRRPPQHAVPRQLPAAAAHFVGRAAELTALSSLLARARDRDGDGAAAVLVIGGTAGVGKTSLAVQWAHQVAGQFPDGQLYVDLRGCGPAASPVSPAEALRGFLDALAKPAARRPAGQESPPEEYRRLLAGRRVLVVLDNARDAAQLRPLLPVGGCAAVITSRSQLTGLAASDDAQSLTLDVLTSEEAGELLERRMGAERLAAEPAAADELTGLCARLPLGLAITAARGEAHPGVPLTELASGLRDVVAKLGAGETGAAATGATSIRAVFSWSYRDLTPGTSRMFRLLALHPGPDIAAPAAGSLAGIGLRQASRQLRALTRAGLLTEPVPGRFALHDLLRGYAAELVRAIDTDGERSAAAHRVLDHYLHTAHTAAAFVQLHRVPITLRPPRPGSAPVQLTEEASAVAWFRAESQVLRAGIAQAVADGFDTHAWQLTCVLAPFAQRSGRWHQHEWSTVLAIALAAARRQGDIAGQAWVHSEFGLICTRLGRYDDALSHLSRALDMYRRLGNQAGQARAHLGLAMMFDRQDHHEEAVRHAERALDLHRSGGHRTDLALALDAAGSYCAKSGDHQRALAYRQQALDLHRERGSGPGEAAGLRCERGESGNEG